MDEGVPRLAVASRITHPATIRIPPSGVTGPRKRNLDHMGGFQPLSIGDASNDTYCSLAAAKARMEPENKIVPPKIAGPANL